MAAPTNFDDTCPAEVAERSDELIAEVFRLSDIAHLQKRPVERFRVLQLLLDPFGGFNIGMLLDDDLPTRIGVLFNANLDATVAKELVDTISSYRNLVAQVFPRPFTYCAASYWSPIDDKRHTLSRRAAPTDQNEVREVLAYAYAFYALSLLGRDQQPRYQSIVQYAIEAAPTKRPINVDYSNTPEKTHGPQWLHLPGRDQQKILEETGVDDAVQRILLGNESLSEAELRRLVSDVMGNLSKRWEDVTGFAEQYFPILRQCTPNLSTAVTELVSQSASTLENRFQSGNTTKQRHITSDQALFMVVTHYLYRRACRTEYIYMTVVRAKGRFSAMTVGTGSLLSENQETFLRQLVRSLMLHPLMRDFGVLDQKLGQMRATRAALRSISHVVEVPLKGASDCVAESLDQLTGSPVLDKTRAELERVAGLLEMMYRMVAFARIARKGDFSKLAGSTCDLEGIAREMVQNSYLRGLRALVSPDIKVEGAPRWVRGTRDGWSNVLWTLLLNAGEHSAIGAPATVTLEYDVPDPTGPRSPTAALRVTNTPSEALDEYLLHEINRALAGECEQVVSANAVDAEDEEEHGFGLAIVGKFLRAVGASARAEQSGGEFIVSVFNIEILYA